MTFLGMYDVLSRINQTQPQLTDKWKRTAILTDKWKRTAILKRNVKPGQSHQKARYNGMGEQTEDESKKNAIETPLLVKWINFGSTCDLKSKF